MSTHAWVREAWIQKHGRAWMDRNVASVAALDKLRKDAYHLTQQEINERAFAGVPVDARILELGCNAGRQLDAMHLHQDRTNLFGSDLAFAPLRVCRWRPVQADVEQLPYQSASVDVVFTSGTLIHLPPDVRPYALREIMRVTKAWIIGVEPWQEHEVETVFGGALLPTLWLHDWPEVWREVGVEIEYSEMFPRLDRDGFALSVYRARIPGPLVAPTQHP